MNTATINQPRTNWAGNYQYKAANLQQPGTVEQIQDFVRRSAKVKALGSCHCFNDIADTTSVQISTENLNRIVAIDEDAMTVTVESGVRYGQLCPELDRLGYALHNLASLPHINIAGACATATHGSGVKNGNLATAVAGIEFVSGTGDLVTLTRENDCEKLNGAVVNLGGLGVVTKVSLDIEPTYLMRQDVFQHLPFDGLRDHFNEIMSAGYSVSLFTNWQGGTIDQVWIKRLVDGDVKQLPDVFCGAVAATENLHPVTGVSAGNRTEQLGVPGVWYERLPHFEMGFTPSSGEEIQSEYFVPREHGVDAVLAIEKMGDSVGPHLLVSEIRTIASDELWLSPCYKRDSVAIHFTWKREPEAVNRLLPVIEAELEQFDARPHWGKVFAMSAAFLRSKYEKMPEFVELMNFYDPLGKFRNNFLERNVFGTEK